MNITLKLRSLGHIASLELYGTRQFCEQATSSFEGRIRKYKKELEDAPSRGTQPDDDYVVDLFGELNSHKQSVCGFGLLMVYATLETYFHAIYEMTTIIATDPQLREVVKVQSWLTLDAFKDFSKRLGVDVTIAPYNWRELKKLQDLRNTIAHQMSQVTEDNVHHLGECNYELGQDLDLKLQDVMDSAKLVEETIQLYGTSYEAILKHKGLVEKNTLS